MARERFIKSDLIEGLGVEGKQPHDAKPSIEEESGNPPEPENRPASDEQDQNLKAKKSKSFGRLSIKEENDANIFR